MVNISNSIQEYPIYFIYNFECPRSLVEGIVKAGNDKNIPYHPFLENYPEYGNITKVNFGKSLSKMIKYAMLIGKYLLLYKNIL